MKQRVACTPHQYCPYIWEVFRNWTGIAVLPEAVKQSGIIFIHIPKTAGTSICKALYGTGTIGHLRIKEWQFSFPQTWRKLRVVSVVRDPLDRFLSAFYFLKKGGLDPIFHCFGTATLHVHGPQRMWCSYRMHVAGMSVEEQGG
jgi:hypothetical protein